MSVFLLFVLVTILMAPVVGLVALWTSTKVMRVREPGFLVWLLTAVGAFVVSNFIAFGLRIALDQTPMEYLAVAMTAIALTLAVSFIAVRYPVPWYKALGVFILSGVFALAIDWGSREVIGGALTRETFVNDDGMLPAIGMQDRVMSFRLWPSYARGDLVEVHTGFSDVVGDPGVLVRRIVGLPGEKIELIKGELYVNGKPTEVHKDGKVIVDGATVDLPEKYKDTTTDMAARTLGADEYFVLADSPKERSTASNGPMKKTGKPFIRGKVIFKIRGTSRFSDEGISMFPLE